MDDKEVFLNPEELRTLIPEFCGGSGVDHWLETIEHYAELYKWQDRSKLLYASCRLRGTALVWYQGVSRKLATFVEFYEEAQLAFPDVRNEAHVHMELQSVTKTEEESYEQYVHRVNAVGVVGKVSVDAIMTYVIRGLSSDKSYPNLLGKRYQDLYELLHYLKWYESNTRLRKKDDCNPSTSKIYKFTALLPDGLKKAEGALKLDSSKPVKSTDDVPIDNTKGDETIESNATSHGASHLVLPVRSVAAPAITKSGPIKPMKPGHSPIHEFNDKITSLVVLNSGKGGILSMFSNKLIQTYIESKNLEGWVKDDEMDKNAVQIVTEINNLVLMKIYASGCYTKEVNPPKDTK